MAAPLIDFESSRKKQAERREKRNAQQELLAQVEATYERRKAIEEGKKRRGEDKWMLPSVNARIKEEEFLTSKEKKAKKKKKHKKEKKHKKKSTSPSSDSSEHEWVEASSEKKDSRTPSQNPVSEKISAGMSSHVQRDDWMLLESSFGPTYSRKDLPDTNRAKKVEEEKLKRLALDTPGQHARELNPYWRDGGTGLPPAKSETSASSPQPKPAIGDGGFTWLERAYQRAVEQSKEEGRSLEEVAAERWGSLQKLERLLAAAAGKSKREGGDSNRHQRSRSPPTDRRHRNDYRNRSDEAASKENASVRFYRPSENDVDDRMSAPAIPQHRQRYPESRARAPAWKNKEFIMKKEDEKKPVSSDSSSSLSSDEEVEEQAEHSSSPPQSMTDDEMNALSAKILKAELLGNEDEAKQLKAKLEAARHLREFGVGGGASNAKDGKKGSQEEEVVLLSRTDHRGMTRPLSNPEGPAPTAGGRRRKKQKVDTHNATGSRTRYFADDDKYSLKQMFEREKLSTAEESNEMFARLAGKGVQQSGADFDMDEILLDRASQKESDAKVEERHRSHAIHEHKRMNESMDACLFCFGNSNLPKHLIIAIASKVYLCLPQHKSLTDGHCLLVPMRHISAGTQLDEDVWEEMQNFKKALTRMFEAQDQDVVFFESSMHLRRFPHMVLHCVPMPRDVGDTAPIYFKKAILESETEWSHNKKVVDLSNKDVRRAVPKGLPYFAVTFGLDGGFAHVIEDEQLFPKNFAQEIIGGILDLEPNVWRKPSRENFDQQRKKVLKFADWWKPYDWTSKENE